MNKNTLTIALLIAAVLLLSANAGAQTVKRGVTEAAIGTDLNEILPDDMIFMYPELLKGSVLFLDKSMAEGLMNIYLPGSHLYFIDNKGDTLVLRDQDTARLLSIGKDTYLRHDKSWVRVLATGSTADFCLKSVVKIIQDQKTGAYGTTDVTSSIANIDRMYDMPGASSIRLKNLQKVPYSLTHTAFLYDGSKLLVANIRNFRKIFSEKRADIDNYVSENKLNLNKAQDALKLFNFLNL